MVKASVTGMLFVILMVLLVFNIIIIYINYPIIILLFKIILREFYCYILVGSILNGDDGFLSADHYHRYQVLSSFFFQEIVKCCGDFKFHQLDAIC